MTVSFLRFLGFFESTEKVAKITTFAR